MNLQELMNTREQCRQQLLQALKDFVRENGEDMNDYFRDEHGIDEEYYGYDVVKIIDVAQYGCTFPCALKINDDDLDTASTFTDLFDSFEFHAFWSFYIARNRETGEESLMYYEFCCPGICWMDCAEPYHEPATELSLEILENIISAIQYGIK